MKETNLKTNPNLRKDPKITMRSHPSKYHIKRNGKQLHIKSFFVKKRKKRTVQSLFSKVSHHQTRLNPNQHFNV